MKGFELGERIAGLTISFQQMIQHHQALAAQVQETRDLLEKLAALNGLEWSQDRKKWVSKVQLDRLDSPAGSPSA